MTDMIAKDGAIPASILVHHSFQKLTELYPHLNPMERIQFQRQLKSHIYTCHSMT